MFSIWIISEIRAIIVSFINGLGFLDNMPAGRHKSRSMRRVKVKTPGSKVVMHYRKRNPQIAHCTGCGKQLSGVPRARPYKMQNMPKTKKRPERPFGGVLCPGCARELIKKEARQIKA